MQKKLEVKPALLEWSDNDPFSIKGEDCYYAHGSGLAESKYVFLQHNNVPQAWLGQDQFTVLETGFGTGLNFLATWQLWSQTADKGARLHFISVEKAPLSRAHVQKALAPWSELAPFSAALLDSYPTVLVDGYHRLDFSNGVTLTLLLGEVSEVLPSLVAQADVCYLDGFNPAKNPSMWRPETLVLVAEKLKLGATFATFTAAGNVRRALTAVGFEVKKAKGFGKKREMLFGRLLKKPAQKKSAPWFDLPPRQLATSVAVIGAGIAGVAVAAALADRGYAVTLFEAQAELAAGASGNPQAVVLPALTADESLYGRFYRAAFLHTQKRLEALQQKEPKMAWQGCGVVQLAFNQRLLKRQRAVAAHYQNQPSLCRAVSAAEIERLSGVSVSHSGLFYPLAGYLDPTELCKALLAEAKPIERIFNCPVEKIERKKDQWQLQQKNSEQVYQADLLVLASGAELKNVAQAGYLELTPARGQLTHIPATTESENLACVLCHEGYLLPRVGGQHLIGATYSSEDLSLDLLAEDQQKNWQMLQRYLPDVMGAQPEALSGRVALRGTTPDQLPLVGGLLEPEEFNEVYDDLCHGRSGEKYSMPPYEKGLYVLAGLGSRGLSSALLSAELLACQMSGEPLPLEKALLDGLNPNRFLVRKLKRK
ncbi:MAG: bifunctional tRNA (5-methylaminomethyl-2-thiouridine)(34)-methyltransferase MnmD/FAD-dependent 5-carboxymethylaminomethyl-2-thiouridine(34) oxidoreductase MnmC [Gammaproteobacteria bacterium]|nr:bifunctional tRNA (5-methylaminomethyl-2-thiouridine)(34)-methyltransferase MnmD/FAD-dependent 5-carboxymethylaminomethyl-2-thiouridine(34) oxidoreductase MnmC [Gammaproteobacteria bacterium]